MLKTIVTTIIALVIFIFAAFCERIYVENTFNDLKNQIQILYTKTENDALSIDDVTALQSFWINSKQTLHSVIPHAEIKEIDLWLSEAVRLSGQKNSSEVLQKFEVLSELCEQIPNSFKLKFENIF